MRNSIYSIRKKLLELFIVLTLILIMLSCSSEDGPTDPGTETPGTTLVDTTINTSSGAVTVNVSSKINITIPQGIAPAGTNLTVTEIASENAPEDENLDITDIYDVELSSGTTFSSPLTIKIFYDPSTLSSDMLKYNIGAAFYDDGQSIWKIYHDAVIDTVENSITFETDHLTKLGKWSIKRLSGYTDYFQTDHFNIYWKAGDVPANSVYSSPNASAYTGSEPHYIQDIGKFMEEAYAKYNTLKLTVPYFRTSVYLKKIKDDGETKYAGYILINNNITASSGMTVAHSLAKACAHEFMHIVQDYYYMQAFSQYAHKWWFEATATQADRIVYPNSPPFESVQYTDENFADILFKSWDDCNHDPEWYQAGGFLAYLSAYRTGTKISIPDLIKRCGSVSQGYFIRDIVNDHIKEKTDSDIEKEYHDYIKWAYERSGDLRIEEIAPLSNSNAAYVIPARFTDTKKTFDYIMEAMPHLSTKMVKIMNYNADESKLKVKLRTDSFVDIYMYNVINKTRTFIRKFANEDSLSIDFPKSSNWIEILMINKHNVQAAAYSVEMSIVAEPRISYITPSQGKPGDEITINGTSFGTNQSAGKVYFGTLQATDITSWSDAQIKVRAPAGVTSSYVTVHVGDVISNGVHFKVGEPAITSIDTYDNVLIAGRATLDINGIDFGYNEGKILFGELETLAMYSGQSIVQWGDLYIKTKIPIDATVKTVQVQTESGDRSNEFPLEYLTIPEFLNNCKGHSVQAGADYTLQWVTEAGVQTETVEWGGVGFSTGGMALSGNGYAFTGNYDSGSETYTVSSSVQFIGAKPSEYRVNGQYSTVIRSKMPNPDEEGSHNSTTISVQYEGIPYYTQELFVFEDRDSDPAVYIKSIDITVYEWDYTTEKLLEKTLSSITYHNFSVGGFSLN